MAKTLAQGRKPGSGRKPGKAKTLKQGRKPGSGRRKRRNSNTGPVMPIPAQSNFNNNNNNNSTNNAHLFQSHLNVIPMNLQPMNLPSNQNIMIPSYNHAPNVNGVTPMNMSENSHPANISTRDMVAVDALRELTHSPLSLTPMTNLPGTNKIANSDKSQEDNVSTAIENLTLPPLNAVFNNNNNDKNNSNNGGNSSSSSSSTSSSINHNNNCNINNNRDRDVIDKLPQPASSLSHHNTEISNLEINRNGSTLPHFHSTESNSVSIDNGISNLNDDNNIHQHQHQHQQHQLQLNNNNLPHNNIL